MLTRGPDHAAQADACVESPDNRGIDRVMVLAMSGGVPPALQLALRHPERTQARVSLSLEQNGHLLLGHHTEVRQRIAGLLAEVSVSP